jgi:hypothetical protein
LKHLTAVSVLCGGQLRSSITLHDRGSIPCITEARYLARQKPHKFAEFDEIDFVFQKSSSLLHILVVQSGFTGIYY